MALQDVTGSVMGETAMGESGHAEIRDALRRRSAVSLIAGA